MPDLSPVIQLVQEEQYQGHTTRKHLFEEIEQIIGKPLVTYFTSLHYPAMIEDSDADMLEAILQKLDLSAGLVLLISSHGGYGEAAERIINVCRSASETGEFWVIVPGKAKSAATMICFGASKILMRASSELGPIDPQITLFEDGKPKWFSLCNLVDGYNDLFNKAVNASGNLQPYLQQLAHYDHREIKEFEDAISLAEDIAIRSLATGMMKGKAKTQIKKKIEVFLTPKKTKSHGRPIYHDEASKCGLQVEHLNEKTELGQKIFELYVRTLNYTNTRSAKCIESKVHSFATNPRTERRPSDE